MTETAEQVKEDLTKLMGRVPDEVVWRGLVKRGLVNSVLDGFGYEVEDLRDDYRYLEDFARDVSGRKAERGDRSTRSYERPAGKDLQPLAELVAIDAARDSLVVAFRDRVLPDGLLRPQDVDSWVREHQDRSRRFRPRNAREPIPSSGPRPTREESAKDAKRYCRKRKLKPEEEGDFLDCLCDLLMEEYPWTGAHQWPEVRAFVLCGQTPNLYRVQARAHYRDRFQKRTMTIVLLVNVGVGPRELMEVYSDARKRLCSPSPQRFRAAGSGTSELALFVAARNDGRSWEDLHKEWRTDHAEAKDDLETFKRKARRSYERLSGEKLEYRGNGKRKPGGTVPPEQTKSTGKRKRPRP